MNALGRRLPAAQKAPALPLRVLPCELPCRGIVGGFRVWGLRFGFRVYGLGFSIMTASPKSQDPIS